MADAHNIETSLTYEVIVQGWMGKPKGMKQVAFERRLLDVESYKKYNKDGAVKVDGERMIDEKYSLNKILSCCDDFKNELTLLQYTGLEIGRDKKINVNIDRSPKCHPEVAGEGIEYTWACSKMYLRRQPLSM